MSYSFIFIYYVSQRFLPSRKEGFRVSQKFVGVGPSRSCSLQNKGYNKKMQEDTYVRAVHRWSRAPSEHLTPPQEQRRGVQTDKAPTGRGLHHVRGGARAPSFTYWNSANSNEVWSSVLSSLDEQRLFCFILFPFAFFVLFWILKEITNPVVSPFLSTREPMDIHIWALILL